MEGWSFLVCERRLIAPGNEEGSTLVTGMPSHSRSQYLLVPNGAAPQRHRWHRTVGHAVLADGYSTSQPRTSENPAQAAIHL